MEGQSFEELMASLDDSPQEVVSGANPFVAPPPPPDGVHMFRIKLPEGRWLSTGTSAKGLNWFNINLDLTCEAEGEIYNGLHSYPMISGMISRSGTSEAISFVERTFGAVAGRDFVPSNKGVVQFIKDSAEGALCRAKTEWQLSVQEGVRKNGKPDYKVKVRGMKNFPPLLDAAGNPVLDKQGNQVYNHITDLGAARAEVVEFLPMREA